MQYRHLKDLYNTYVFGQVALSRLKGCKRVLELGCGDNSLLVKSGITERMDVVGVDIFQPYLERHMANRTYNSCICADITRVDFADGSFDAVVCMDVLEHISKQEVLSSGLLEKMQRWGNKVIITTPNGYIDNEVCDENRYQEHVSDWSIKELEDYGYKVRGLSGWKKLRIKNGDLRYTHPFLFWAGLSLMSEVVARFIPKLSFHLLAVYEKRNGVK